MKQTHAPHRYNESYRTEHTDRREVLNGIHAVLNQCVEGYGVRQRNSRHKECHTHGVQREQCTELHCVACTDSVPAGGYHERSCQKVAEALQFLCLYPAVGYYTHQRRHKQTDYTLYRIEPADVRCQTDISQIASHRRQVGAPDGKLQEVEEDKLKLCFHTILIYG